MHNPPVSHVYKGETGEIDVRDETLVIRRSGVQARVQFGKDTPDRAVPLQAVRDVLFKEPGKMSSGALRLVLGAEPAPAQVKAQLDDYDAMTFTAKQADAFRALHQWLQGVAAQNHADGVDFAGVAYDPGVNTKTRAAQAKERAQSAKPPPPYGAAAPSPSNGTTGPPPYGATAAGTPGRAPQPARPQTKQEKFAALGVRDDIAAAAGRMGWTLGGKREIKKLSDHVDADETVQFIAQGTYGTDQGIVVLTDRRMLFVFHGLMRQAVEDFPLDRISSVHSKAGVVTGDLTIHASGNQAVIKQIVKTDLKHLADALRTRIHAGSAPPPPPPVPAPPSAPAAGAPDVMEQLRKLGELHSLGVLTDEEFAAKKTELLSRL